MVGVEQHSTPTLQKINNMKKVLYTLGIALALASCGSNGYEDWADPQSNAEESAMSISFTAAAASAIDFNTVTTDSVTLFTPTVTTTATVQKQGLCAIIYNADKSSSKKLIANINGKVSASELKAAMESLYGKKDDVHSVATTVCDTIHMIDGTGYLKTADITSTINLVKPNYGEFFYEIGNESGWKTSHALYGPDFDGKYEGCYYLNGEFKFKPNADNWDGDYEYAGTGKIADNGGSNCPDPGAGFYKINVDLGEGTYSLTKINNISIIGTVNGNWDTDTDLTYNTETGAWETTATLNAGAMKFRMNHDWTISWGGSDFNSLTNNNGSNLNVAAGTYKIQLYLTYNGNSKVVMTAQ